MSRAAFWLVAVALAPALPAAPVPKGAGKPDPEEVKKRVYGCWKEVRRETAAGTTVDREVIHAHR